MIKLTVAAYISILVTSLLGAATELAQSHTLLLATMASAVTTIITVTVAATALGWQQLRLRRRARLPATPAGENNSPFPPNS